MFDRVRKVEKKLAEVEAWRGRRGGAGLVRVDGVVELMSRVRPWLIVGVWHREYARVLEGGVSGGQRVVLAAPVQHGKTTTTLFGLAWLIINEPDREHAYITYSQERANSVSLELQMILRDCGIQVKGTLAKVRWSHGRGKVMMTSIDGGITGEPIDGLCVIDDPIKNMQEATSSATRKMILETFQTAIMVRVHKGSSIICMATRWDPQDLSGTLIEMGWEYRNYPAFAEEGDLLGREVGEPLFPELWSREQLLEIQATSGQEFFDALYQGRPRPKGGKVFHEPTYYRALPNAFRGSYGVDLAYTSATSGDNSVCLELLREEHADGEPMYYVKWVDRAKIDAPEFALLLKRRQSLRPTWPMMWRNAGTEKGVAQFLRKMGITIRTKKPPGDKYVSAMDTAALWNRGRIVLPDLQTFPECEKWMNEFLEVMLGFSGNNKEVDDDVDALGAAEYVLRTGASVLEAPQLPVLRM